MWLSAVPNDHNPLIYAQYLKGQKGRTDNCGELFKYSVMEKPSSLIFTNIYAIMKFQLNKKVRKKLLLK